MENIFYDMRFYQEDLFLRLGRLSLGVSIIKPAINNQTWRRKPGFRLI